MRNEKGEPMQGRTHMTVGVATAATASLAMAQPINPVWIVLGAVGALIPDLDHEFSTISTHDPFTKLMSKCIHGMGFKHRTITHCFLGWAIFCAITLPLGIWVDWGWWFALSVLGYGSHLFADSFTKSGIMWFWPFSEHSFHFFPIKVRTGGYSENVFNFVAVTLLAVVIIVSIYTVGIFKEPDAGMTKIKNVAVSMGTWFKGKAQDTMDKATKQ